MRRQSFSRALRCICWCGACSAWLPGTWAVVHSAAGGVGSLAGRWLRALGAHPIGIVGAPGKVAAALASGYEAVFVRGRDDWPARVRELSGGGAAVVYDPVGRETWEGSLACLAPRGHLVCFGNSSGLVPPFSVNGLRDRGSLSLSWVRVTDYTADPAELQAAARELFAALAGGASRRPRRAACRSKRRPRRTACWRAARRPGSWCSCLDPRRRNVYRTPYTSIPCPAPRRKAR